MIPCKGRFHSTTIPDTLHPFLNTTYLFRHSKNVPLDLLMLLFRSLMLQNPPAHHHWNNLYTCSVKCLCGFLLRFVSINIFLYAVLLDKPQWSVHINPETVLCFCPTNLLIRFSFRLALLFVL